MTREERPRRNPISVLLLLLIAIGVDLITRGRLRLFVVAAVLVLGSLAWNGTLRVPGVALSPA